MFVHTHRDGGIAYWATFKYLVAVIIPFWDGKSAPGRAYTKKEQKLLNIVRTGKVVRWPSIQD